MWRIRFINIIDDIDPFFSNFVHKIQFSLARLGVGFRSALADVITNRILWSPLRYGRRLYALRVKAYVNWTFYPQGT